MTKILFVCGKNRRRSPSAEEIFTGMDGIEVSSAGTSPESECQIDKDLLDWADRVFVMEESQRRYLRTHFPDALKDKKIVCLRIPDVYGFMQPELIAVLRAKVMPLLRQSNELNY
jgi:predicted protein tyrosine phosphatase